MSHLGNHLGRRFLQFTRADGLRKTISLGRVPKSTAQTMQGHLDHIITQAATAQPIRTQTAQWLADISDKLHRKFVKAGLVAQRGKGPDAVTLKAFLDGYIAKRIDVKPQTRVNLEQSRDWLVKHFGEHRDLRTINRGEIGDWHRLIKSKLAAATASAHVKKARQMFQDAVDRKLIDENPLRKIKAGAQTNPERLQYVPASDVRKVIEQCPDVEWKLIFALARFGGLRIPSESNALKWSDIRWDEGRMIVHSPKTEHHRGKDKREVPIFPELLPFLREAFERADAGATQVLGRRRGENLRTTAEKIIGRTDLKRWPRLFQNLRSSCETDLTTRFPVHVACAWIGNSQSVAMKHYLQVTDAHFESAAAGAAIGPANIPLETKLSAADLRRIVELCRSVPPVGFEPHGGMCRILVPAHETLRRALRSLKNYQRKSDARALARLGREVRRAQNGGGA